MCETLYSLIHLPVLPAWALLLLAPRARLTDRLGHSGVIPVLPGLAHAALLFSGTVPGQAAPGAGMHSLPPVMALVSHPVGTLTGWAHFLAFDLFARAWVARDAARLGWSHGASLPALCLCLLFGPLGLLLHMGQRRVL